MAVTDYEIYKALRTLEEAKRMLWFALENGRYTVYCYPDEARQMQPNAKLTGSTIHAPKELSNLQNTNEAMI